MNTPVFDFVSGYAESDVERLHMPGHKGRGVLGAEKYDITEIFGADSLFRANGIIRRSEENAAKLFGTALTLYGTEGSSLFIKAMLALVKDRGGAVLAGRNCHKSFVYAAGLLDVEVRWLLGEGDFSLCRCRISPENVKEQLKSGDIGAVYLTSPDYLGGMCDVKSISEICHSRGVPLLIDNAHGAYLAFLEKNMHPTALGADACCDSAHKTLPVLTGGAYLHISKDSLLSRDAREIRAKTELFASTSPSYLTLCSLDCANKYLADGYAQRLAETVNTLDKLKRELSLHGIEPERSDPLRLTLRSAGTDLSALLRERGFECEYEDPDFTVMMFTPENIGCTERLLGALLQLMPRNTEKSEAIEFTLPARALSVRQAMLSPSEIVPVHNAEGRICACALAGCPPAVPIVVCGERISKSACALMKRYGIGEIAVVKQ